MYFSIAALFFTCAETGLFVAASLQAGRRRQEAAVGEGAREKGNSTTEM